MRLAVSQLGNEYEHFRDLDQAPEVYEQMAIDLLDEIATPEKSIPHLIGLPSVTVHYQGKVSPPCTIQQEKHSVQRRVAALYVAGPSIACVAPFGTRRGCGPAHR